MKGNFLIVFLILLMPTTVSSKELVGRETHDSAEACRKAINQYVKDTATGAGHNAKNIKIEWFTKDSVSIESDSVKQVLYCEGRVSVHKVSDK